MSALVPQNLNFLVAPELTLVNDVFVLIAPKSDCFLVGDIGKFVYSYDIVAQSRNCGLSFNYFTELMVDPTFEKGPFPDVNAAQNIRIEKQSSQTLK